VDLLNTLSAEVDLPLWEEVKEALRSQDARPESELRRRLPTDALIGVAPPTARDDPAMSGKVEQLVE